MWVSIPTVVLLALFAAQDIAGETAPLLLSTSDLTTDEQGQPWPASAAGYPNFSQLSPTVATKDEVTDDIPLLQSAPTPSANMISLDMSNPNTNFVDALEKILAPELSNVKVADQQQTIPISINITPPPNANMDFVKALQVAVRTAVSKLVPSAGTSLKIAITKASTGAIVNVKAYLDIVVPAAVKKVVPTLPPSNVPEIDLTKGTSGLVQNLQSILLKELLEAGYSPDAESTQDFSLSFSVLPPEGATKDFVRLDVLGPLQTALNSIAPHASITSVSVNTQQSNSKILRQTVKLNVRVNPPAEFQMNENVVEVPEVVLNVPGANIASTVVTTLQNQIMKIANVNPSQAKTLSIPFKITPPAGATQQQIMEMYVIPISQVLSKLDPTGKILKLSQKTLPNGDIIIVVYMNIPANATTKPSNEQNQPEVVPVVPETSTTSTISINNRNSFPEGEEDEIPSEVTNNEETSESTIEAEIPNNAIKTPTVDLTTPTASVNSIRQILNDELSPLSNPVDDGKPKVLAIPFVMKPPAGATLEQIQENVVVPIGRLLTSLEPTGNVITSQTKSLPNGDVESVVYFNIPSVKNSETYKDISDELQKPSTSTEQSGTAASTQAPVTSTTVQEPIVSPVTKSTQNQTPKVGVPANTEEPRTQIPEEKKPENSVVTTPIDLSHPNFDALKTGIEERLNDVIKNTPNKNGQPQTIGFPFVVPKDQAKRIPIMAQAIATLLKGLVPSGNAASTISPKVLPNGDVEFTIYYEVPAITKPNKDVTERPANAKKNLVLTPIDIKNPDFETLRNELDKKINDITKTNNNGQPQEVEIPLVISKNLKSPFFEIALRNFLQTILPGKVSPKPLYKDLQNGDVEMVFNYETPATTEPPVEKKTEKNTEAVVSTTVTPKTVISTTSTPKTQNEVQPENNNLITPIDVKNPDFQTLKNELEKKINEISTANNGQPQEVGIPLVISKNLKSPFFEIALRNFLQTILPGEVLAKPSYKDLPNGDVEMVFNYKIPATSESPAERTTEVSTQATQSTTVTPKTVIPTTTTIKTQNKINTEKTVLIPPINIKNPNFNTLVDDIKRTIEQNTGNNNGQPQIIGIPFIMPSPPPYIVELSLKKALKMLLPGEILPETQTNKLPDGNVEFIIYYEKPSSSNNKPSEEVVAGQTEPSVEKKQEQHKVLPTVTPKTLVKPVTEAPQTVQPENSVITTPISLQQIDFNTIKDEVEKRIDEASKTNNGKPEIVGLPFIMPNNQNSYMLELGLMKVLGFILPGEISPNTQTKVLPNGEKQLVIFYKLPGVETIKGKNEIEPVEAVEDVNLDEPGSTVLGEVGKALIQGISTLTSNPENLNKPANLKFNIYAPLDNTPSQNKGIVDAVSAELQSLEPSAKIVTAKVNEKPLSNEPDGVIEITLPSIATSNTAEGLKKAVKIPTIDTNIPELNLVGNIKALLQRSLKKLGQLNPKGSQLFDFSFRLNPFDTKGSVAEILKALKAVDPTGQVVSYKISSRPDGLDYLDVSYLIPRLEDSIIYEIVRPQQPEVVYESVVDIDTRNPINGLLEKVVSEVGAAEDEVKGAKKEQLVDLPLDFKFTNSRGLSDSEVSRIVSQTLPYIQGYISQVLPDGNVKSINTVALPNSDDVILKILVRTPYEPDNTIVIEEERPRVVVTTPKPKSKGLFGLFGR
ncbi:uncharacterized protein LOC123318053 isoform X2 [Coccinella septempunctata]|uniref:uncharacterized protein LOC123318053 isoform X2 n=1 Tax=Coccinella septempunctata TaxID=41139 RepID=UPI001D06BCE5|nr:uncharacterized protein LOC123318053 isoform X2 [Coccinella septempunctata]